MRDEEIIRFLSGECTPEEDLAFRKWMNEDEANAKRTAEFNNLCISQSMPQGEASDAQFDSFRGLVDAKRASAVGRRRTLIWSLSAAAVVALAVFAFMEVRYDRMVKEMTPTAVMIETLPEECINTMYVEKGVKGMVSLPDGSTVWLNSDSKITYPARFEGTTREVRFSGEGYFDVRKDSLRPMIIRCNKDFRVEVFGTTFNIKSYDNDPVSKTTLFTGSIRLVETRDGQEIVSRVKPNETVRIFDRIRHEDVIIEDPVTVTGWKDGKLVFDSITLGEAAKMMERWHGVTISIKNPNIAGKLITATFSSESLSQIMELLKFSLDIDYRIDGSKVEIF